MTHITGCSETWSFGKVFKGKCYATCKVLQNAFLVTRFIALLTYHFLLLIEALVLLLLVLEQQPQVHFDQPTFCY